MFLRGGSFFSIFEKLFTFFKKLLPFKHILALPTWGQKCLFSELQPIEIKNFDWGHPVLTYLRILMISFKASIGHCRILKNACTAFNLNGGMATLESKNRSKIWIMSGFQ